MQKRYVGHPPALRESKKRKRRSLPEPRQGEDPALGLEKRVMGGTDMGGPVAEA